MRKAAVGIQPKPGSIRELTIRGRSPTLNILSRILKRKKGARRRQEGGRIVSAKKWELTPQVLGSRVPRKLEADDDERAASRALKAVTKRVAKRRVARGKRLLESTKTRSHQGTEDSSRQPNAQHPEANPGGEKRPEKKELGFAHCLCRPQNRGAPSRRWG